MKNLKTKYMGIELENPIILGASNLSTNLDNLKKAEELGFAAVVYKSLFEEQIQLERFQLDEKLTEFNDIHAEMLTMHPNIEYTCYDDHLFHLRKAKESLSIPVFASLNAVNHETWIEYSRLLSETGVDGIELNFYKTPLDFNKTAQEIEQEQIDIVRTVKQNLSIPVSVKLSTDYTNILNHIQSLDSIGVDAVVLFNSFFQPDIDIATEQHIKSFNFSKHGDYKKSLRYAGLLYGNVRADICSSHGIYSGSDVVKLLLSGSSSVQVVSSIYKNGLTQFTTIRKELETWMDQKNYQSIDEFIGKLSNSNLSKNSHVYKRAQYVDLLLNSDDILGLEP
jgi:dihydroorotate dehydrogenase (fumarate)